MIIHGQLFKYDVVLDDTQPPEHHLKRNLDGVTRALISEVKEPLVTRFHHHYNYMKFLIKLIRGYNETYKGA